MPRFLTAGIRNWKTTTLGVILIATTLLDAIRAVIDGDPSTGINPEQVIAQVTIGIGLIVGRDADKTSEQSGAKK